MRKLWLLNLIIAVFILIAGFFLFSKKAATEKGYYEIVKFAKCLNEKGAVMYGADWCPYCQNQKKMFGEAFAEITYVNCDFHEEECREKDIDQYPLWYIGDVRLSSGVQPFSELSHASGCKLYVKTD